MCNKWKGLCINFVSRLESEKDRETEEGGRKLREKKKKNERERKEIDGTTEQKRSKKKDSLWVSWALSISLWAISRKWCKEKALWLITQSKVKTDFIFQKRNVNNIFVAVGIYAWKLFLFFLQFKVFTCGRYTHMYVQEWNSQWQQLNRKRNTTTTNPWTQFILFIYLVTKIHWPFAVSPGAGIHDPVHVIIFCSLWLRFIVLFTQFTVERFLFSV